MPLDLTAATATANALPYSLAPFSAGLTAADYAAQHAQHGEQFCYFEPTPLADATATSNRDGNLFVEAELGGNGYGLFYSTKREIMDERFGLIPKGSTMFSCLPSVVEFVDGARLCRTAQEWKGNFKVTRGSGDTDPLPERFVTQILKVTLSDGTSVDLEDVVEVTADTPNDSDVGGIQWLDNAPDAGTDYTVLIKYHPWYSCLGELIQGEPLGADGERLPQRVLLKKERE